MTDSSVGCGALHEGAGIRKGSGKNHSEIEYPLLDTSMSRAFARRGGSALSSSRMLHCFRLPPPDCIFSFCAHQGSCPPAPFLFCPTLRHPIRSFQTLQKGYDVPAESLYAILGLEDTKKSRERGKKLGEGGIAYDDRVLYSSEKELTQAFVLQVSKLKDPVNNAGDQKRLEELKNALRLLLDPRYRAQYRSHYSCSVDAKLGILQDGGEVGANYNPEHQQFFFFDHSRPVDPAEDGLDSIPLLNGSVGSTHQERGGAPHSVSLNSAMLGSVGVKGPSLGSSASPEMGGSPATTSTSPSPASSYLPRRGGDISVTLRLSFEEGWRGGSRVIHLAEKEVRCIRCDGTGKEGGAGVDRSGGGTPNCNSSRGPNVSDGHGRKREVGRKRCPQCFGRGHVVLPSATYYIHRPCTYCMGEGIAPPRACSTCQGRGVVVSRPSIGSSYASHHPVPGVAGGIGERNASRDEGYESSTGSSRNSIVVHIPPCTTAAVTSFRLHGKGHSGRYGGPPGDVHLTLLVAEHRYYYYQPMVRVSLGKAKPSPSVSSSSPSPASHPPEQPQQQPSPSGEVVHQWHLVLPISLTTALLGGRVTVPHPGGVQEKTGKDTFFSTSGRDGESVVVAVPPGAYNGFQIQVALSSTSPTSSLPSSSCSQVLVVHVLVMVPKGHMLTARQHGALRVFEEQERQKEAQGASGAIPRPPFMEGNEGKDNTRANHPRMTGGDAPYVANHESPLEGQGRKKKGERHNRCEGGGGGLKSNAEALGEKAGQRRKAWSAGEGDGGCRSSKRDNNSKMNVRRVPLKKETKKEYNRVDEAVWSGWSEQDSARLWEECTKLKRKYRHWLRVP